MTYCCSEMKQMDSNGHVNIMGDSYLIAVKNPIIIPGESGFAVYELEYCPFCGSKLEETVSKEKEHLK